jgi:hypothetical protein
LVDGARVLSFFFIYPLADSIRQITDENDKQVGFLYEKKEISTSVILPEPTRAGKTGKLTFKYAGKAVEQDLYGDFYIKSTTYWYPQYGYLQRATYDLTFRCPRRCKFVSIGKKVEEKVEKDYLVTRWVEDFPIKVASFNYGNFKIYEKSIEGMPPVYVYHLEETHRKTRTAYTKSKENVAADVVNSLNFFQTMYGKYPFSKMAATEIPAYGGQGLPGLLHLSWGTFKGEGAFAETRFRNESFRAHEVSHQWWGHIIGWETYHDQWLSEGFAEYSGAWYAQMSMKDNEAFFKELEGWRKDILGKGDVESEGTKAGPLWLGYRLSSSKSSDYAALVYEKGAYVLHMLRNMMMDYNTKSDDKFVAMMRDFVQTYYGKEACTEDFKQIVEKHIGEDMSWFFDQWVYGVEIPTYVFSYTTEKTSEGKYVITCDITQENVSQGFKMWVPVLLDFGNDQYAVLQILVNKPHATYQLPKAPLMPKKVIFNPYHAVLCEVKNK